MRLIRRLYFLRRNGTSLGLCGRWLAHAVDHRLRRQEHQKINAAVGRELDAFGSFTRDWFDHNAYNWIRVLGPRFPQAKPLRVLEIGAWEGRCTCFLLHRWKEATVTAMDTWEGSREHQVSGEHRGIEERFDQNTHKFQQRLRKFKAPSYAFFHQLPATERFDLIYVDGSHEADDVMIDAIRSFQILREGGVMVFDDFVWDAYDHIENTPSMAINLFLRMKRGQYRLLSVSRQLMIAKVSRRG